MTYMPPVIRAPMPQVPHTLRAFLTHYVMLCFLYFDLE